MNLDNHLRAASVGSAAGGLVLILLIGETPYVKACVVFSFVTLCLRCLFIVSRAS